MSLENLKERITIQTKAYVSDRMGGYVWRWADGAQIWAEIQPCTGKKESLDETSDLAAARYWVKWRKGIDVKQRSRFLWRGQILKLLTMPQEDATRRWVNVLTYLEVPHE